MNTSDSMQPETTHHDDAYGGRSLVAIFPNRQGARDAAARLREDGFHHVWIGVTHVAPTDATGETGLLHGSSAPLGSSAESTTVVETDAATFGEKVGRFFTGDSIERSLASELAKHGVDRAEAARIEDQIPPETSILTVDGANHPEAAATTIESCGGHVISGEAFAGSGTAMGTAGAAAATGSAAEATSRRGSEILGYGDPDKYARGSAIEGEQRVQLRAERLNIDKQREGSGEATVGKRVVEQDEGIDVPLVHEELFVERRAPSATAPTATGAIGSDDTIHVPLMRERVVVTKRPVVTGEYTVGKRDVQTTQTVNETTRQEELVVNDPANPGASDRSAGRPL